MLLVWKDGASEKRYFAAWNREMGGVLVTKKDMFD